MLDISLFTHIPKLPGGEVSAEPLIWLVGVAAVLTIAGLVGFRRRGVG
jgi:ABC-2 type transport system permease protein